MPGVSDVGMVWMGAGQSNPDMSMDLMSGDNSDMLLDHDNSYFTPSLHSMSNQSMDDIHTIHSSQMVICTIVKSPFSTNLFPLGRNGKSRHDAVYRYET